MASIASAECPLCGKDQPHAHTRHELTRRHREQWLRAKFEEMLDGLFSSYLKLIPGSYGMALHLTDSRGGEYFWWPVEMLWRVFCAGAGMFAPPYPPEGVPDINEAYEIERHPFGASHLSTSN